jgi:hypothetical protein
MNENLVSGSLSAEDVSAIKAAVETIQQKLPFLTGLDPEARRALPRMGDKSRAFVRKCLEVGTGLDGALDELGRRFVRKSGSSAAPAATNATSTAP